MNLAAEQRREFERVSEPLMRFLAENCHPHITVLVRHDSSVLLEGVIACTPEGIARGAAGLRLVDPDGG
jgi:hypothetical protein